MPLVRVLAAAGLFAMSESTHCPDFIDLRIRAEFLDLCGERDNADALRRRSLEIAREVDINCYAYQLLWRGHIDAALELLHLNAELHPESWNVYDSLGEVYAAAGDTEKAVKYYARAMDMIVAGDDSDRIRAALNGLNARRAAAELAHTQLAS